MNVSEIMTTPVTAVRPETPLKEVAALFVDHGISGVPVVDEEQRVLGVVSETDIAARSSKAAGAGFDLAGSSKSDELEREARLEARTAGGAMTRPAVTITSDAPVASAAASMFHRDVHRLPVVDRAGRLVGIVSRTDLVRAFARSDQALEREIRDEVLAGGFLWCSPGHVRVEVTGGDVVLTGKVESEDVAALLTAATERVLGVLSVRSQLEVDATPESTGGGRVDRAREDDPRRLIPTP